MFGGTSSSTPKVAGVAALILSANPDLTQRQVKRILRETADDIDLPGVDDKTGAGRVNAYQALQAAFDGADGAIIAWTDWRGGTTRVYAQRINGEGSVMWMENGVAISTKTDYGMSYPALVSGAGGVIIAFQFARIGVNNSTDIYAQRVTAQGNL